MSRPAPVRGGGQAMLSELGTSTHDVVRKKKRKKKTVGVPPPTADDGLAVSHMLACSREIIAVV